MNPSFLPIAALKSYETRARRETVLRDWFRCRIGHTEKALGDVPMPRAGLRRELVVSPIYSKDFGKLGKSYAKMLVNQSKKDKVIGKK
jgi:hypothetical protein